MNEPDFPSQTITSWEQFLESLKGKKANWIFRGQSSDQPLRTTLERALNDYQIDLKEARAIEEKLIRDFQRKYFGLDHEIVLNDTLYCLSLMRHHSAPMRLLDFNYSAYIAAFFAFNDNIPNDEKKDLGEVPVVWCLNKKWLLNTVENIPVVSDLIPLRNRDTTRNDQSFIPLYMGENP